MDDEDRELILYYLRCHGKIDPVELTDGFWAKAQKHGFLKTYYAIRKAAQEDQYTIEHITNLIGNIVKEGDEFMYRQGVDRSCCT